MVHIASLLSKEMSQNVHDIRIKQPIPEAAIDITANLSNGITQKRKHQRMSPATLMMMQSMFATAFTLEILLSPSPKKQKPEIFLSQSCKSMQTRLELSNLQSA